MESLVLNSAVTFKHHGAYPIIVAIGLLALGILWWREYRYRKRR